MKRIHIEHSEIVSVSDPFKVHTENGDVDCFNYTLHSGSEFSSTLKFSKGQLIHVFLCDSKGKQFFSFRPEPYVK